MKRIIFTVICIPIFALEQEFEALFSRVFPTESREYFQIGLPTELKSEVVDHKLKALIANIQPFVPTLLMRDINVGSFIYQTCWNPQGTHIALACKDGRLHILDYTSGQKLTWLGHSGVARTIAWSPDGSQVVSGGYDGLVKIWDAQRHTLIQQLSIDPELHLKQIDSVSWSKDNRIAAACNSTTHVSHLIVWNATTGIQHISLPLFEGDPRQSKITTVAFNPGNNYLALSLKDATIMLYDTQLRRVKRFGSTGNFQATARSLTWNHAGTQLLICSRSGDADIWSDLWAETDPSVTLINVSRRVPLLSTCWGPEEASIVIGNIEGTLTIVNRENNGELYYSSKLYDKEISSVSLRSSGDLLACGSASLKILNIDIAPLLKHYFFPQRIAASVAERHRLEEKMLLLLMFSGQGTHIRSLEELAEDNQQLLYKLKNLYASFPKFIKQFIVKAQRPPGVAPTP